MYKLFKFFPNASQSIAKKETKISLAFNHQKLKFYTDIKSVHVSSKLSKTKGYHLRIIKQAKIVHEIEQASLLRGDSIRKLGARKTLLPRYQRKYQYLTIQSTIANIVANILREG